MFRSRSKKVQALLTQQAQPKKGYFDLERIALFFQRADKTESRQVISDNTFQDLDLDEVFMSMDRTVSLVGQQYLYYTLRTIPRDHSRVTSLEHLSQKLNGEHKGEALLALNRLSKRGAYYLQRLIFEDHLTKPKWAWLIPILSLGATLTFILSFFLPGAFLIAVPLMSINIFIHYWNKNNLLGYSNTIPQLLTLHQVTTKLYKWDLVEAPEEVNSALVALKRVVRSGFFFSWESKVSDEISQITDIILELLKGAFLLEPLLFFNLLKRIERHRSDVLSLFTAVGRADVALSLAAWRESLPYYSQPQFQEQGKAFEGEAMYHPLIVDAVANDLSLNNGKSILLSGSNMSGKTTFIRTIGINTLLAQTLNTVCAQRLSLPRLNVYSAIRIADNLMEDASYYYEEVQTIKGLVEASDEPQVSLFLLDELFKGTNTVERIASGKAVLSYLHGENNLVFCSTHDLELMEYLAEHYDFYHFAEVIENEALSFDYTLKAGRLTNTNAIRILELNQFPNQITEEAQQLAQQLHQQKQRALKGNG